MPELPDVESYKRYLDKYALNCKINHIEIHDSQVIKPARSTINKALKSAKLDKSQRVGKNLLVHSSNGKWILFHFGMTGTLEYFKESAEKPKYSQLILHFDNDHALSFISKRKLGKFDIVDSPEKFVENEELGPDAMEIDREQFIHLMQNRNGMIKSALMDQKLIAGLGNVYVDEIIYQAKIHPETKTKALNEDELNDLYRKMTTILKTTINHEAQPRNFPNHYLTKHRKAGETCPNCKGKIKKIAVNGRGTYICGSCQKKPS